MASKYKGKTLKEKVIKNLELLGEEHSYDVGRCHNILDECQSDLGDLTSHERATIAEMMWFDEDLKNEVLNG